MKGALKLFKNPNHVIDSLLDTYSSRKILLASLM